MSYLQLFFPALLVLCAVAIWWHARTRTSRSQRFLCLAFAAVVLFCWPPVAWLVTGTLEWPYSEAAAIGEEADAIVVLGGGPVEADGAYPAEIPAQDTLIRCRHAARLHRRFPDLPILVCGGGGLAESMRKRLVDEGVDRSVVALEPDSSSTHENAVYGARVLEQRGIRRVFLVTEAHHMLRAELSFERQGMAVVPAPCGFRSDGFAVRLGSFLPGATAITQNEEALHEWIGLAWYWFRGRI